MRGHRNWAFWAVAAGVLGIVATLLTDAQGSLTDLERRSGAEVVELVDRAGYHAGAVAGYLALACLLVAAAGWRRWAEDRVDNSLAARVVTPAFIASAGAMVIAYGFKGAMAIYLPGGINEGDFPNSGLYVLFAINDLGPFLAWWGVAVAAGAVAWLSLRERVLPAWLGVVSALAFLAPAGFLAGTGLTGFAGVVGPLWLVIAGAGLALGRMDAVAAGRSG